MIEQTFILAGAGLALGLALAQLRASARAPRVGWVITEAGQAALAGSCTSTRANRTAGELLIIAARELADAVALHDLNGPAWAGRARHLARTVQATEARRRRYNRAKAPLANPRACRAVVHPTPGAATLTPADPAPDVVTYDPAALPGVAS